MDSMKKSHDTGHIGQDSRTRWKRLENNMISDSELAELVQLSKNIKEKYPISNDLLFRITSIAQFSVFVPATTGPTNEYHEAFLLLLNSLHLLVYDVQKAIKEKLCEVCRCKAEHEKGCQCWNDE